MPTTHRLLTVSNVLIAILVTQYTFAGSSINEPHSHTDHDYEGSVYNQEEILTLPDAIKRAIDESPYLKSLRSQIEAAEGAELQASYQPNPELSFEVENFIGTGEFNGADAAEFTLEVTQTLEKKDKRLAREDVATAIKEQINSVYLSARLTIERDVHIAYGNILSEAESVKLAIEQEELAKNVLKIVSKRVKAAADSEIQKSKADVAYGMSVISREQHQQQLAIAKATLARFWGSSELNFSLDHSLFYALQPPQTLMHYQKLLIFTPDIQRLQYLKSEKQSLLKLEQALAKPDPNISFGLRDFRESGDQALMVGVSIPITLHNQNKGNIAKAQSELHQADSESQQAIRLLEQQLSENWQAWSMAYAEANRLNQSLLPAAERSFALARSGYERGRFPYLEVLDAQRTLFDARSQYHDALKRYHAARAHVERLTSYTGEK